MSKRWPKDFFKELEFSAHFLVRMSEKFKTCSRDDFRSSREEGIKPISHGFFLYSACLMMTKNSYRAARKSRSKTASKPISTEHCNSAAAEDPSCCDECRKLSPTLTWLFEQQQQLLCYNTTAVTKTHVGTFLQDLILLMKFKWVDLIAIHSKSFIVTWTRWILTCLLSKVSYVSYIFLRVSYTSIESWHFSCICMLWWSFLLLLLWATNEDDISHSSANEEVYYKPTKSG